MGNKNTKRSRTDQVFDTPELVVSNNNELNRFVRRFKI